MNMAKFKEPIGGMVFKILSKSETDPGEAFALPNGVRGHLVMVLGWDEKRDWVRLATVSKIFRRRNRL